MFSNGANHILCTSLGPSHTLHFLIVLLSYKMKDSFPTNGGFALSNESTNFHCYFGLNSSAEVSVYLKILVMISVIFVCIQGAFIVV